MPQAQTNSKKIVDELGLYLQEQKQPDDFTRQRFIREIDKLPSELEQVHARGVLEAVCRNKEGALELLEQAVRLSNSPLVCSNYWVILKTFGTTAEIIRKGYQLADLSCSYSMQNELLVLSGIILDLENVERIYDVLSKAKKLEERDNIEETIEEASLMNEFIKRSELTKEQLAMIGELALQVAHDRSLKTDGNYIEHKKQRSHLSVSYVLDADSVSAEELFDINYDLIERLVENDLDRLPVVVQFHRQQIGNVLGEDVEDDIHVS